ncbi:MAG: phosphatase PAP2 family protein [Ilumatobacteraceae bacterium]
MTSLCRCPRRTVLPHREHRMRWWKEAALIVGFYLIYSWTRNQFGSSKIAADGIPEQAFNNAERIVRLERFIGLYHEETMQELFLSQKWFIQFWNTYYGTAHFAVTVAVFIVLFLKRPGVFPQFRNTLLAMTALRSSASQRSR